MGISPGKTIQHFYGFGRRRSGLRDPLAAILARGTVEKYRLKLLLGPFPFPIPSKNIWGYHGEFPLSCQKVEHRNFSFHKMADKIETLSRHFSYSARR